MSRLLNCINLILLIISLIFTSCGLFDKEHDITVINNFEDGVDFVLATGKDERGGLTAFTNWEYSGDLNMGQSYTWKDKKGRTT